MKSGTTGLRRGFDRPIVIALVLLACTIPLLAVDFPPLTDLYGHLGRFAIQTRAVDLPAYFAFEWRLIGNLGADLLVEALYPYLGLEDGVHLVTIACQLIAAAAIIWISREVHGRVTPFAILALPLIYAVPFAFGFLNFSLSMALALLTFAGWLRLRRRGRSGWARLLLVAAALPLWLCHTYGWAFLGLLCGASALASEWRGWNALGRTARIVVLDSAGLLIALVPMLLWRGATEGAETGGWTLGVKAVWFASALRTSWPAIDIVSTLCLLAAIYLGLRGVGMSPGRRFDPRLGLAALFALLAFLALPSRVFSSFYADMRLVPYIIILGLLALRPPDQKSSAARYWWIAAALFLAVRIAATTADFRIKQAEVDEVLAALPHIPENAQLATFVVEPCQAGWRLPLLDHIGGVVLARRGVFTNNQWNLPGVNLLRVEYDAAGRFGSDPSQMVAQDRCPREDRLTLSRTLETFPREAFSHVWLLGERPAIDPAIRGYEPIWRNDRGVLYARTDQGG